MKYKKGEGAGPIGVIFLVLLFVLNWFLWLGDWISTVGQQAIDTNNLTGIEAFGYANLNFFIFIILVLGVMAWLYFGGNQ